MRKCLTILMLGLAGCSSGLLEASTEPPTGIDVALTTSFSAGTVPTSGSVVWQRRQRCGDRFTSRDVRSDTERRRRNERH